MRVDVSKGKPITEMMTGRKEAGKAVGGKVNEQVDAKRRSLGHGPEGSILVHVGTNNADKEGTTRIVQRYRQLVGKLKKTKS